MTEISLISPFNTAYNMGLRTISSVLRRAGYRTKLYFLPMPSADSSLNITPYFHMEYPEHILKKLAQLTIDSRVIGISLMDQYIDVGIKLTKALKREDNMIVWGGPLATLHPEQALQYADIACIGDGENAMLE